MIEYSLLEVLTEPYIDENEENKYITLMGKFFIPSKNMEVMKRIGVVNLNTCRIIYDNISCPKEVFDYNNQKEVLAKAVEILLGYYYGKSKGLLGIMDNIKTEVNTLDIANKEHIQSSIFDKGTKTKLARRVAHIKAALSDMKQYYAQIHEYIALYVYTTIFKTMCKNDVKLFTSAINGICEELTDRYNFTSGIGLSFSIMK